MEYLAYKDYTDYYVEQLKNDKEFERFIRENYISYLEKIILIEELSEALEKLNSIINNYFYYISGNYLVEFAIKKDAARSLCNVRDIEKFKIKDEYIIIHAKDKRLFLLSEFGKVEKDEE